MRSRLAVGVPHLRGRCGSRAAAPRGLPERPSRLHASRGSETSRGRLRGLKQQQCFAQPRKFSKFGEILCALCYSITQAGVRRSWEMALPRTACSSLPPPYATTGQVRQDGRSASRCRQVFGAFPARTRRRSERERHWVDSELR